MLKQEQLYLNIINNINDGVYYVDNNRTILFWNKAAEEITGYTADEIIGKKCQDTKLNHIDKEGHPLCLLSCPLYKTIIDGVCRQDNVFVRHKNGYRIPVTVNILPVIKDGETTGAIEVFTKSSPRVYDDNLVENLTNAAMHDAITGLPNRQYLESFLEYKLSQYKRFGECFAVMFADIDDFKNFNNEHGHNAGDTVLVNIAESILNNTRSTDLIGRWGGEEFVGIFAAKENSDAKVIGEKFHRLIGSTEIQYGNKLLSVTVSVGITTACTDDTIESIVERADRMMYISKRKGKNCITLG